MKSLKKIVFAFFILSVVISMVTAFNFLVFMNAPSPDTMPVYLEIPKLTSFNRVVTILKQKNLISNAFFFPAGTGYFAPCNLSGGNNGQGNGESFRKEKYLFRLPFL